MKRHESLQPWARDHHEGLVLARSLRWAAEEGAEERRRALVELDRAWTGVLSAHFEEEEQWLTPLLAGEDEERLRREHDALRALVRELLTLDRNVDPDPVLLLRFSNKLNDHIRWEDRELFVRVEEQAPPQELADIGPPLHEAERSRPRTRGGGACVT